MMTRFTPLFEVFVSAVVVYTSGSSTTRMAEKAPSGESKWRSGTSYILV
ncbi:MAG: hypothetical protein CM1200mP26_04090 [Acidimicrobiales bacterium]|nr:MAG: hypothetical protein CM1200mP26_04090 [Acidimicrobiales bacterium]